MLILGILGVLIIYVAILEVSREKPDGKAAKVINTIDHVDKTVNRAIKDVKTGSKEAKAAGANVGGWILKVLSIIGIYFFLKFMLTGIGFGFLW
jgi:hypothetical protein